MSRKRPSKKSAKKKPTSRMRSFLKIVGYTIGGFILLIFSIGILTILFDEEPDLTIMDRAFAEQKNKPAGNHPSKVLVLGEFEEAGTYDLELYVGNYNSKKFNGTLTVYINYEKEPIMKKVIELKDIKPGSKERVKDIDTNIWEEDWIDIAKFNYTYKIEGDFAS